MRALSEQTVVVAGATGNVGPFVVRSLLEREATVVVSSRSAEKLEGLREHLSRHVDEARLDRLHAFVGDLGDEAESAALRRRIAEEAGPPDAVVASVGAFVTTPSLLDATAADLQQAFGAAVLAHHCIARTFLPAVRDSGGTYVLMQGPLAFELYPELGTDLISIATAAQHMLFRALARQLDDDAARVVELTIHTYIRERETSPGTPLTGEAVGEYAAQLLSGAGPEIHGRSIELRSTEQLAEVDLEIPADAIGERR
jgi:NAD(P)-dependent dehydrogenase (short-subunit alcohol dehydrogenase family)